MRHLLRKLIGWMLCLAMAVGMLPGMTRKVKAAEDSGEYIIDMSTVSADVKVDSDTGGGKSVVVTGSSVHYLIIEAKEGEKITVLFRDVDIYGVPYGTSGVFVQGDGIVTIQLEGDNTVEGAFDCAGIQKSDNVALTITSSKKGKLTAIGGEKGAGIGGGTGGSGSNITISGNAIVTATGGKNGAGIGGGDGGEGSDINISGDAQVTATGGNCGAGIGGGKGSTGSGITISGDGNAQITAKGGELGAGIGGGYKGNGEGINITISVDGNAQVTATGGAGGAGIGGGAGIVGGDDGEGSNITISVDGKAQVTATGGESGAGIGGGMNGAGSGIIISGDGNAQVTANGGTNGAGIGGGYDGEGSVITISGEAHVTANGGESGAGIGGGYRGEGSNITISGDAQVEATGGNGGAGIGGGDGGEGSDITISGDAQVTATGGEYGAGIGGGNGRAGSDITISGDAQVTATAGDGGAGIGGGKGGTGSGITISGDGNAQITAKGGADGAGIGGGNGGEGSGITISGNGDAQVTATAGDGGAGIGGGNYGTGSGITISGNAQVTANGGDYGAGIGGGYFGKGSDITISGDAQVTATGGKFGAGIGGGDGGEGSDITISGDAQVTATGGLAGAGIGGGYDGKGSGIKVYDKSIVSVSGGKDYTYIGAGAGVGDGGKYDSNGTPPDRDEAVITFTDDDHKTFNGNVLYYEKGSSAESIKNGAATRINFLTILLKANDGTDAFTEQTVSVGVPTNLQKNSFTRKGHSFTGWNTQADGEGTPYADQSQQVWKTNTILYAQWHKHVYDRTVADETKYRKSAATCTKAAVYYKSCACGAFDPDESGTFESGNPLGHDYKAVAGTAKDPTCTAAGKEANQECSRCHDVITGTEIARLAHTFNQEVATDKYLKTPADCAHKAVYFKSCVCGETGTETFESGEALGHDYKDVAGTAKAATCNEAGKEADKKCERCGDVITGTVIAKTTDHKWKAATGYDPKTCEICGATEGDVIKYDSETGKTLEHTQGDNKDETITLHRSEDDKNAFDHLKGVQIDGEYVNPETKSGSVIITFDAATLNKLSIGDHIITVIFDDWVEELKLIIKAPVAAAVDATPVTGDAANPLLWAAMILLSMAGVAVMVERKRYGTKI